MKRFASPYILFSLLSLFFQLSLFASGMVDPHFRILEKLTVQSPVTRVGKVSPPPAQTFMPMVGLFIKTTNLEALRIFFDRHGGKINSVIGNIVTGRLPLHFIEALQDIGGVLYVEMAQPVKAELSRSRHLIGADSVQEGTANDPEYKGEGVIIGFVDSGIDWKHETFRGANNKTRVLSVWDQSLDPEPGFISPREMVQSYGLECPHEALNFTDVCPSKDTFGHGTHVAGIAAGNHAKYKGIAPSAGIIAVKIPFASSQKDSAPSPQSFRSFSNHVVDGVNYIFQKASTMGKPAVVNISLGTHFGPHDDSSLFEQALNGLVEGEEGRVIVVAAGNEARISGGYLASIHAGFSLSGETRAVEFLGRNPQIHSIIIDVWQPADSNLSFALGSDDFSHYETTPFVAPGESGEYVSDDGKVYVLIDATEARNPLNGKKHTLFHIAAVNRAKGASIAHSKYNFDLIVRGSGSFDAWLAVGGVFSKRTGTLSNTPYTYLAGDSQHTISVPGTASHVLTVGSHVSRIDFKDLYLIGTEPDMAGTEVGNISSFSSLGPTVNPNRTGQKPEIIAPGEWIMSALSSDAKRRYEYTDWPRSWNYILYAGTSMASPHVTGAAALLLERNPALNEVEIERLLCQATSDGLSEALSPNNQRGYGHLNIARAMIYFEEDLIEGELSIALNQVNEIPFKSEESNAENGTVLSSFSSGRSFKAHMNQFLAFLESLLAGGGS